MASVYKVLPLSFKDNVLTVAIGDPANLAALDDLRNFLGINEVSALLATPAAIAEAMTKCYAGKEESIIDIIQALEARRRACGAAAERDEHRPGQPDGDRGRRPGPQAAQHGDAAGHQGPGQRHPLRAVRGRVQDALPLRRRAVRDGAAAAPPGHGHRQPHQGHGQPRHRRAPPAAGRPHRAERRRQPGRHARQRPADHVRRERRHPRARPHRSSAST